MRGSFKEHEARHMYGRTLAGRVVGDPRKSFHGPSYRTYILDTETTGLLRGFERRAHGQIGISQLALREETGRSLYNKYSTIIKDPLQRYDEGKLTAKSMMEVLAAGGPAGTKWQKGFQVRGNVLAGTMKGLVDATRASIAGRGDLLAKESELVGQVAKVLESGHKLKGWNLQYDMIVLGQAAARESPALAERWYRAVNIARNRGMVEDMSSGVKKFMFLAAQESFMKTKLGGEAQYIPSNLSMSVRLAAKAGKVNVKDIDRMGWSQLMEPHEGFQGLFQKWFSTGRQPASFEGYQRWLEAAGLWGNKAQTFATGQLYPNIEYIKGWSADVIAETLSPGAMERGLSGTALGREVEKIIGKGRFLQHEAVTDTVVEQIFEDIFKSNARTYGGMWDEVSPRLKKYGIYGQREYFNRFKSGIQKKAKSQLREVAEAGVENIDDYFFRTEILGEAKQAAGKIASRSIPGAAAHQPQTLRQIYSGAARETMAGFRGLASRHPILTSAATILAGFTIFDSFMPHPRRRIQGVRRREMDEYQNVHGIYHDPFTRGPSSVLTDFGTGRSETNVVTKGFAEESIKSGHVTDPGSTAARNQAMWTRVRAGGEPVRVPPGPEVLDQPVPRPIAVKALDFEDVVLAAKATEANRKYTSIHTLPMDANLRAEYPGSLRRTITDPITGQSGQMTFEQLLETQQALRQVKDPTADPARADVTALVDRPVSRYLQTRRAAANVKMNHVQQQALVETEALLAAGKIRSPGSKSSELKAITPVVAAEQWTGRFAGGVDRLREQMQREEEAWVAQELPDRLRIPYVPYDPPQRYQIKTAGRSAVLAQINERIKDVGFLDGIRDQHSPWGTVGHGIVPSHLRYANVSSYGSGRPKFHYDAFPGTRAAQLSPAGRYYAVAWSQTGAAQEHLVRRRLVQMSHEAGFHVAKNLEKFREFGEAAGVSRKVLLERRWTGTRGLIDPVAKWVSEFGAGLRTMEDLGRFESIMGREATRHIREMGLLARGLIADELGNRHDVHRLIEAGRSDGGKVLAEVGEMADKEFHRFVTSEKRQKLSRIYDVGHDVAPHAGLSEGAIQSARAMEAATKQHAMIKDDIRQAVGLTWQKPPRFIAANTPEVLVPKVESAIKQSSKIIENPEMQRGMSATARKGMQQWKGFGLGFLAIGAAMVGLSTLMNRKNQQVAEEMATYPAFRHPNEYVGMRQYGDFHSSYAENAWAQQQMAGNAAAAGGVTAARAATVVEIAGMFMFVGHEPKLLKAWSYFAMAGEKGAPLLESGKALGRVEGVLRKMGFTGSEIDHWGKRVGRKFVAKVQERELPSGWLGQKFQGLKDFFRGADAEGKKAVTKTTSKTKLGWHKEWIVKPHAARFNLSMQELERTPVAQLKKMRDFGKWARESEGLKYLWKNLIKDARGLQGKIGGFGQIFRGFGKLHEMRLAHEAGLLDAMPAELKGPKNVFAKWAKGVRRQMKGEWIKSHPNWKPHLSKFATGLERFGRTGTGRALSRVPLANVAFGVARGLHSMDQYENATKGFLAESAAGAVSVGIEFAFFNPAMWVTLGAAIGSVIPGAGTAAGAFIGTAVGTIIAAAASMYIGYQLGEAAGGGVRSIMGGILRARKKVIPDPAAYTAPGDFYKSAGVGFPSMRSSGPGRFHQFSGIDSNQPSLSAFGSGYTPERGEFIDSQAHRTAQSKRHRISDEKILSSPPRFTPTFGLVNNVLWNRRNRSRIASSVARRSGTARSPHAHRNRSRMMSYAA